MFLAASLQDILSAEVQAASPFRICTLVIFALAVIHTFLSGSIDRFAGRVIRRHREKTGESVSFWGEILKFLGEVEIVFALWVIPLVIVITIFFGWDDVVKYLDSRIYIEPFFVVIIMSLASSRPIIHLAEKGMHLVGKIFGDTANVWWLTILFVAPIMGSLITEAASMTIAALLLKEKIYFYQPSKKLAYGTIGLLFVNLSVGGVLTNFAAPPALILSRCWNWSAMDFFTLFGWRVLIGLIIVNALYYFFLRKEFAHLKTMPKRETAAIKVDENKGAVPIWISFVHVGFLVWTIVMAHYPAVFVGGYMLFLGFHRATRHHQYVLDLKRPLLVGLFLAGLVIHGEFQGWWIGPLLGDLGYGPMMLSGTVLTAFNENSTVAYLGCLLDNIAPQMRYALVSGLVAGGGLTIIAHAPNPAGQSLLRPYFRGGISPWNLFLSALIPTLIFLAIFFLFPSTM